MGKTGPGVPGSSGRSQRPCCSGGSAGRVTHRLPHSGTHTVPLRGLQPPCQDKCYLLAWDPWSSGWADLSGKTRGPLGNKRKTCGRTFHPRRGALLSEGCMWRLVYGDRSFSNISSVARTFFFFGKGNSMGLHNVKQISTEHVWVRVSGLGGADPGAMPTSLSLLLPPSTPGLQEDKSHLP